MVKNTTIAVITRTKIRSLTKYCLIFAVNTVSHLPVNYFHRCLYKKHPNRRTRLRLALLQQKSEMQFPFWKAIVFAAGSRFRFVVM